VTDGNALLTPELGRTLVGREPWDFDWELPAADLASNPFGPRVAALPVLGRRALLAATLSGHLSLLQLAAVADSAAVEDLLAVGLLAVGKSVRPSHPLLAAAVRRRSTARERRALHRDLAELVTDLIEALLRLGRIAEAVPVAGRLRDLAEDQGHPWGLATANRCDAAIVLASRYDEEAASRLEAAAAALGELGLAFDRARSLLWLGQAARRATKRAAARRFLEASAAAFDELGSGGWAEHARGELARLGTRRPTPSGQLTAAEQRVADLAADGLSNKEIARHLFVAVHTVEVHLAHAFAKLGVRSRTQLAGRLAVQGSPPERRRPS
jgi:DNA-binding CsgD family transcriptional regulator